MKKNKDLGAFLKIHELRFPKWIGPSGIRRWWQTGPKKSGVDLKKSIPEVWKEIAGA